VVVECLFVEQQGLAMMASSTHTLRATQQGRVAHGTVTTEQGSSMPDADCQERELQFEAGHCGCSLCWKEGALARSLCSLAG